MKKNNTQQYTGLLLYLVLIQPFNGRKSGYCQFSNFHHSIINNTSSVVKKKSYPKTRCNIKEGCSLHIQTCNLKRTLYFSAL